MDERRERRIDIGVKNYLLVHKKFDFQRFLVCLKQKNHYPVLCLLFGLKTTFSVTAN